MSKSMFLFALGSGLGLGASLMAPKLLKSLERNGHKINPLSESSIPFKKKGKSSDSIIESSKKNGEDEIELILEALEKIKTLPSFKKSAVTFNKIKVQLEDLLLKL